MTADLDRIGRELEQDPALTERILREFPAAPIEPEPVTIRVNRADVDRGICRALAWAVRGVAAKVELKVEN